MLRGRNRTISSCHQTPKMQAAQSGSANHICNTTDIASFQRVVSIHAARTSTSGPSLSASPPLKTSQPLSVSAPSARFSRFSSTENLASHDLATRCRLCLKDLKAPPSSVDEIMLQVRPKKILFRVLKAKTLYIGTYRRRVGCRFPFQGQSPLSAGTSQFKSAISESACGYFPKVG